MLTMEEMEAFAALSKMGFAFFVNLHNRETGRIIRTARYPQWLMAVRVFEEMEKADLPASISLTRAVNTEAVRHPAAEPGRVR